jgi:hypothetical protein
MSEANGFFAFDESETIVSFNARPNAENPVIVHHKLRKPELKELLEYEAQSTYERVSINSREDEVQSDDERANINLWNKLIVAVKGYKGVDDWRALDDAEKATMRVGHKLTAIHALYAGYCELEESDGAVSIGDDIWTVRQNIGVNRDKPDFVITHTLREPSEAERAKFGRSSSSTSQVKGAKRPRIKVRTNLKAYVDLYDTLIVSIEGGTVNGQPFSGLPRKEFLAAVDGMWKLNVVMVLMSALEGQLSD